MRNLCYENQFSFILKLEPITTTKISHLELALGNSEMAHLTQLACDDCDLNCLFSRFLFVSAPVFKALGKLV